MLHSWAIIVRLCVTFYTFSGCKGSHEPPDLEPQLIIGDHVTVSGFGSGGLMAQIMQIAHSHFFKGVGVFSSTYYRCGPSNGELGDFNKLCTKLAKTPPEEIYSPDLVHKDIEDYLDKGLIDNPSHLRNKRLYVWVGLHSSMYTLEQSLNIVGVWEKYIKNAYKIKTKVQDAGYVMPTNNLLMENCTEDASQNHFLADCRLIGAFEALKFLHADHFTIHHPLNMHHTRPLERLRRFNQSLLLQGLTNHFMDDAGYYYVPSRCQLPTYPCLLHVFFHGCENGRNQSGSNFIGNSGFLQVAERNDIVMLFPQSRIPKLEHEKGIRGCWDHFGVGGDLYATRNGAQVQAVWKIINAVIGVNPVIPVPHHNHPMTITHLY